MNRGQTGSVSIPELIDAKLGGHQRFGSKRYCPSCGHELERKPDSDGLPAGVKFDPTDQELLEHLEAKVTSGDSRSHPLIDEFIPTIGGEDGICYTHPEKLPGVTRDGLSKHFFHRPSKAYTTGTRKRRKIQTLQGGETRWHKTGKTRPVMANGKQKGCKKILVLYTNFGKNRKPEKTNWVMHQYHLGLLEEEKEGELVVSKVFFQTQPRQCNLSDRNSATATAGPDAMELTMRDSGSASSSSRDVVNQRDDQSSVAGISEYSAMDLQRLNSEDLSFEAFGGGFNEVGMGDAAAIQQGMRPEAGVCEEQGHQRHVVNEQQRQAVLATHAFHVGRTSGLFLPPTIVNLDDPFAVSRMLVDHDDKFQGTSIPNTQETDWLKYSYWPDPADNHN